MNKIVTIVGARPQFIKAAVVSSVLLETKIQEIIVHTGQHFDANMSDIFFQEMHIPLPNYNLEINNLNHGAMTGRMMEGIEEILVKENPDLLMVYGDTNSTLAGALAAKKMHIKVAHVEAGLRSFNLSMPEEINRILTDRISDLLFCPTSTAVNNLQKEGFDGFACQILQVGDVMYDAALFYEKLSDQYSHVIDKLKVNKEGYILATMHRQENTDDINALTAIIEAFNILNEKLPVLMPIHPRTKKIIKNQGIEIYFRTIDPVGYFDMIQLIKNCRIVITDSGGLQKEAYFYGKYCITVREQTEWIELVENGYNYLTGANSGKIISIFEFLMQYKPFDVSNNLYGNGKASLKIAQTLQNL
jgi:UDP-GlcNAc3NAcA epimerase